MQAVQPTLLHVAGYGRSGSTLLDVLLGNRMRQRGEIVLRFDEE